MCIVRPPFVLQCIMIIMINNAMLYIKDTESSLLLINVHCTGCQSKPNFRFRILAIIITKYPKGLVLAFPKCGLPFFVLSIIPENTEFCFELGYIELK